MNLNLIDTSEWKTLKPLTFTRPVADLRIGILTIAEKWQQQLKAAVGFITQDYLQAKYPSIQASDFVINGSICPDPKLISVILSLKPNQVLIKGSTCIAWHTNSIDPNVLFNLKEFETVDYKEDFLQIQFPEDIFKFNDIAIKRDFDWITKGRESASISSTNIILGDQFFAEEGAEAECSTFNTRQGPIYLGKNSQVWEGSHIRGSFALCDNSDVKMGAKIYGQTTIGPHSRVGGEINNAVIWGYSSKGHDGYLGNAVLGQWCNIGADSNNSNLKNNYAEVRLWDYNTQRFRPTGMQFCGLIMADHAKCAINTMFNTGTVAGVSANIFGSGFPRNFIPDFSWGGAHGFEIYTLKKMYETSEKVYSRRNMVFNDQEKAILEAVFENTQEFRHF
ncbi:GlmU family protein [Pedobacter flavus]|uniref:GlmU family protein n=1 Tax=Pedobacter flavus TaxID=3113906 RepID=A0ABU7H2E9_9SPHI|nr:GlmU family protein [Pedobacter sp. VNH31]MEE1885487.1 GlmU family protein [Pedobacter sp. VNH31]